MSEYTRWYRDGTVKVTKGSTAVTGTSTYWKTAGLKAGDMLTVNDGETFFEIASISSDTALTLKTAYTGTTATGSSYAIVRNFTSTMPADIAAQTAELLGDFRRYIDADMQSIQGKSAYQVAKDNGYTGTESQWLESLKAAGEWSSASTRLTALEGVNASARLTALEGLNASTKLAAHDLALGFVTNNASMKNSIARFKNLGTTVTSAQRTAIKNEDWSDLYIGDNWTINGHKYYIAAFAHAYGYSKAHPLMYAPLLTSGQMNTTDTNSGGYYNSYMFNTFLPETVTPILQEDWGDLLITHYDRWPSSNASGICSTHSISDAQAHPVYCMLPTYKMVDGHPWAGYGQDWNNLYGMRQLPFFAYWYNYNTAMTEYPGWLQDCANNSTQFVFYGRSYDNQVKGYNASESKYVSPMFFLG